MAEGDYPVGYKKPPLHTRFQKGRSGNPNGRPKGSLSIRAVLDRELRKKVTIKEHGITRRVTKLEAAVKQVANKAATGDAKAFQVLYGLLGRGQEEGVEGPIAFNQEDDLAVMEQLMARLTGGPSGEGVGEPEGSARSVEAPNALENTPEESKEATHE